MSGIMEEQTAHTIAEDEVLQYADEQLNPSIHADEERIYPMRSIKVERGFFSAYELKRKHDRLPSQIVLDSEFQREGVWKLQQKRELIESILMGLPLPIFYFNEDKAGRLIVIDGRQRLNAIFSYLNNEFLLDKLKILDEFNKKRFCDLSPVFQSKIEDYQIVAHVIQPMTPDRVKFDIFDRVNRAGTKLNKQEIRNALYQGEATRLLNRLSKSGMFAVATENSFVSEKRMKNRYLILRFIAFFLYYNQKLRNGNILINPLYRYSGDIDELLGLTMEYLNLISKSEIDEIERQTLSSLAQVSFYLGENAFRLVDKNADGIVVKRYPINMNIFETLMYGMTLLPYKDETIKDKISIAIDALKSDAEFLGSLNNHRDSESKVSLRFQKIRQIVGEFT